MKKEKKVKKVIGWREWTSLPDFDVARIKAKIDSGAKTSSLHADDVEMLQENNETYIQFKLYPMQDSEDGMRVCKAKVIETRSIKSSNGMVEERPVIMTSLALFGETWPIEMTLTNRDQMGFQMLLGRDSFKKLFLVDADKSYCAEKFKQRNETS